MWESVVTFRSRKEWSSKKVCGNTALCFQEILGLNVSLSSLVLFSTGFRFKFLALSLSTSRFYRAFQRVYTPLQRNYKFSLRTRKLVLYSIVIFLKAFGLRVEQIHRIFLLSYFSRHAIRILSLSATNFPFSKLCFVPSLNNTTDFVQCILTEKNLEICVVHN